MINPEYDEDTFDAEVEYVDLPALNEIGELSWKMSTGERIKIKNMTDSHLRNCALFLMGMGFGICRAPERNRINWLTAFRTEWERRMIIRKSVTIYSSLKLRK